MPKKSKKTNKKSKKPSAKGISTKKTSPKGSNKKATPATKKLKMSAPSLAGTGFAAVSKSLLTEAVVKADCLPYPLAEALVYKCGSPEADGVLSSTPLGNLFGGARLAGFCQCVANGVPCSPSKVPCSAIKTLQDVVDAIACK
jgi:hypothetical protein